MLVLVLAADMNLGIGRNNGLPWSFAKDMKFFKNVTQQSTVIIGSGTWAGLEAKGNRLPGRDIIILSNKETPRLNLVPNGSEQYTNAAKLVIGGNRDTHKVAFVIGGSQIYREFADAADYAIVTRIHAEHECDAHLDTRIMYRFSEEILNYDITDTDRLTQNAVKLSFTLYGSRYRAANKPIPPSVLAAYERGVNSVKGWFD